jgi:glycosyltransferase involved in cell wall biosynthesis
MLSICAVMAVRNEAPYLRVLLPLLASQQIEVAILDNGSNDESREICLSHWNDPVIMIKQIPYRGFFSLSDQLDAKQRLYDQIRHDWVIHHDADELFEHFSPGLTLRDAIREADEYGSNVLNFDEFVFLPEMGRDYFTSNYYKEITGYYYFLPERNRLNRAWKRAAVDTMSAGGHRLSGDQLSIYPINHILRHYIVLGYEHARQKYLNRKFDDRDLEHGWHANRLNFTEGKLTLPESSRFLFRLDSYKSKAFCRDQPASRHYWDWK